MYLFNRHGLLALKIGRLDLQHLCNQHVLAISKGWTWKDYLFRERMYIVLSLLAKTALAWQIRVGALQS